MLLLLLLIQCKISLYLGPVRPVRCFVTPSEVEREPCIYQVKRPMLYHCSIHTSHTVVICKLLQHGSSSCDATGARRLTYSELLRDSDKLTNHYRPLSLTGLTVTDIVQMSQWHPAFKTQFKSYLRTKQLPERHVECSASASSSLSTLEFSRH